MVGDGDERAPPDAPELKRRRKSPRLAEAAEREAEPEHGSGGAPEGERRGGCERLWAGDAWSWSPLGGPALLTRVSLQGASSAC